MTDFCIVQGSKIQQGTRVFIYFFQALTTPQVERCDWNAGGNYIPSANDRVQVESHAGAFCERRTLMRNYKCTSPGLMKQACCQEWGSCMTSVAIAMCTSTGVVHNFCNPNGLLLRLMSPDALVHLQNVY